MGTLAQGDRICLAALICLKGSPLRKHCHERLARGVSGDDHELGPN